MRRPSTSNNNEEDQGSSIMLHSHEKEPPTSDLRIQIPRARVNLSLPAHQDSSYNELQERFTVPRNEPSVPGPSRHEPSAVSPTVPRHETSSLSGEQTTQLPDIDPMLRSDPMLSATAPVSYKFNEKCNIGLYECN